MTSSQNLPTLLLALTVAFASCQSAQHRENRTQQVADLPDSGNKQAAEAGTTPEAPEEKVVTHEKGETVTLQQLIDEGHNVYFAQEEGLSLVDTDALIATLVVAPVVLAAVYFGVKKYQTGEIRVKQDGSTGYSSIPPTSTAHGALARKLGPDTPVLLRGDPRGTKLKGRAQVLNLRRTELTEPAGGYKNGDILVLRSDVPAPVGFTSGITSQVRHKGTEYRVYQYGTVKDL